MIFCFEYEIDSEWGEPQKYARRFIDTSKIAAIDVNEHDYRGIQLQVFCQLLEKPLYLGGHKTVYQKSGLSVDSKFYASYVELMRIFTEQDHDAR